MFLTAVARNQPNESRSSLPSADGAQAVHCGVFPRAADRVHAGRCQDVWRLREQAAAQRTGVRLLRSGGAGDLRQRECQLLSAALMGKIRNARCSYLRRKTVNVLFYFIYFFNG